MNLKMPFVALVALSVVGTANAAGGRITVSAEVVSEFTSWETAMGSAPITVAKLKFTNLSQKTCQVKRYIVHWPSGSFEQKPTDFRLEPGASTDRTVNLQLVIPSVAEGKSVPVVVQVLETSCK